MPRTIRRPVSVNSEGEEAKGMAGKA